jgi:hypothetical protein
VRIVPCVSMMKPEPVDMEVVPGFAVRYTCTCGARECLVCE